MRIQTMLGGSVGCLFGLVAGCGSGEATPEHVATQTFAIDPCDLSAPFDAAEALFPDETAFEAEFDFYPDFDGLSFSSDGSYAYLSSPHLSGTSYDIMKATFVSGEVDTLDVISALSTANVNDRAPFLRANGLSLYLHKINGSYNDIYLATRGSTGSESWSVSLLGSPVNDSLHDQDPFFVETSGRLYFASERGGGSSKDLYYYNGSTVTQLTTSGSDPVNVSGIDDYRPVLSEDELTLYFASQRTGIGGDNDGDIFISQRANTSAAWGPVTNLVTLNSSGRDFPVALSSDQCTLYFASNEETGAANTDHYRLYKARRHTTTVNPVTLTLKIKGTGSVTTSPFNCSHTGSSDFGGTGTCSANAAPGTVLGVEASSSSLWIGECTGNNGNPSTDAVLTWARNAECYITIQ
jgi:hypothetical protein